MPKPEYAHLLTIIDNRHRVNREGTGTLDSFSVLVNWETWSDLVGELADALKEAQRGQKDPVR